ncbi:MAG: SAM-dependent methyltransferase [Clostridia bacterium]|nr:SAM-dependent methyltransferase [Clostridia bacterium]
MEKTIKEGLPMRITDDLQSNLTSVQKLTFSDRKNAAFEFSKVVVRPFAARGETRWQLEQFKGAQVFHKNLSFPDLLSWVETTGAAVFRQALLVTAGTDYHYTIFPDRIKCKQTANALRRAAPQTHDRKKEYLLNEGENVPALVDLGVFTPDFRVVKSKYDKFKQINRFLALIDDRFAQMPKQEITILDFGCGKSYLTFILYHYFVCMKGVKATVLGFDLKADVVDHCNRIAEKYGYDGLHFYVNDVTTDALFDGKVDMIITLHACDTATDFALLHAIRHRVPHIFSVPCCQHEINAQIRPGGDFDLLLAHGLLQERFSALLTDAIRAEALRACGYAVDVLEFVDFAHSPKNLMLRCTLKQAKTPDLSAVTALCEKYGFRQTLVEQLLAAQK